jgi:hypothetical protein
MGRLDGDHPIRREIEEREKKFVEEAKVLKMERENEKEEKEDLMKRYKVEEELHKKKYKELEKFSMA